MSYRYEKRNAFYWIMSHSGEVMAVCSDEKTAKKLEYALNNVRCNLDMNNHLGQKATDAPDKKDK